MITVAYWALGGEVSSPRLMHLFSALTYISADLSSEWFLCLDDPSLGIKYPNFAGVSEFKPRFGSETAGWSAISKMFSNVYIFDLNIHTILIRIFLFNFPSMSLLSPWLCLCVALKSEGMNTTTCKIQFWYRRGGSLKKFVQKETFTHSTSTVGIKFENARCSHLANWREFPKHWSQTTTILPEYRICPFLRSTSERLGVLFRVLHRCLSLIFCHKGIIWLGPYSLMLSKGSSLKSIQTSLLAQQSSRLALRDSLALHYWNSLINSIDSVFMAPPLLVPFPHLVCVCIGLHFKHHMFFTGVDEGAKTKRCHDLHGT